MLVEAAEAKRASPLAHVEVLTMLLPGNSIYTSHVATLDWVCVYRASPQVPLVFLHQSLLLYGVLYPHFTLEERSGGRVRGSLVGGWVRNSRE